MSTMHQTSKAHHSPPLFAMHVCFLLVAAETAGLELRNVGLILTHASCSVLFMNMSPGIRWTNHNAGQASPLTIPGTLTCLVLPVLSLADFQG